MSTRLHALVLNRRSVVASLLAVPVVAAGGVRLAGAQSNLTVTMVTDTAGLGDQNFNDLAKRGLDEAAAKLGVKTAVIESRDQAAYVPNLTQAAESSDLTIGVGFLLTDAITEVANQYADKKFLLIDSVSDAPNVASVTFKEQQGAFLAGVVAGKMTKTNKLGVVGGVKIPPVVRYVVGFEAGAKSVNPAVDVIVAYADNFDDPALGKELSLAQYNQGADIVFPVAGKTGVGSFDAAKEKGPGVWVIAADVDQSQLGAQYQLAVARKGVDTAVFTVTKELVDGDFKGGPQTLGLKEDGVGLATPGDHVPQDVLALVDRYKAAIIAGALTVPADEDELKAFTPVSPDALPAASPVATPA
ncbi:MAG TPA: BMP family ABC transporter substrate-binding protein [Thermomicrobiales bacterium]|nr:BMP family ABC transporter substrate-binding protein [Thermomicrobiales bacterium]